MAYLSGASHSSASALSNMLSSSRLQMSWTHSHIFETTAAAKYFTLSCTYLQSELLGSGTLPTVLGCRGCMGC